MNININAEDVERLFKEELLKAGIGGAIAKGIAAALSGYNSPVEAAIKQHVHEVVVRMLREEPFVTQLADSVRCAIAAKLTKEVVDEIASAALERIDRAARERY